MRSIFDIVFIAITGIIPLMIGY